MPFLYVYQLSDFDTTGGNQTPPNEVGALAGGSPPFNFCLLPGATPILVEVTDTDGAPTTFGELGNLQTLTNPVTIDGVTYPAGDTIRGDYILSGDASSPTLEVAAISIGTPNSGNNIITGLIATEPLVPGQKYEFTTEMNYNGNQRPYEDFVCFTTGTWIETAHGPTRVEDLCLGDRVVTKAAGLQPIRWIGQRTIVPRRHQWPVEIQAGVLGNAEPLRVSPQHRVLLEHWQAELLFAEPEILVPAIALVAMGKAKQPPCSSVTYHHFMFDDHQLVLAQGAWAESLLYGAMTKDSLSQAQRDEIEEIFPELALQGAGTCLPCISVHEAAALI